MSDKTTLSIRVHEDFGNKIEDAANSMGISKAGLIRIALNEKFRRSPVISNE